MEPPPKPDDSDCCNSGCSPCIFDVYEEQLRKYKQGIAFNNGTNFKNCISQISYSQFELIQIVQHTSSTFLYTFKYITNDNDIKLHYNPGQHLLLKGRGHENDDFTRAYTPIPLYNSDLSFTILVKLYEHGKMSRYLKGLKLGAKTLWRGPYGNYKLRYDLKHILFIAQGTGIAPIFAVIDALLKYDDCYTFLKLYFCCQCASEILLRNELYDLSSHWNFTYEVFLSQGDRDTAKYNEMLHYKRVDFATISNFLNEKRHDDFEVLVCGSECFTREICDNVTKCGVDTDKMFVF